MRRCFECGLPAECDHHVVPRSKGGTKTVPLCGVCHGKAHHAERNMSSRKLTRDALQTKIAKGERVGKIRFGYDLAIDGKTLVRNTREQEAICQMREWRAQGKTYRDLVKMVEDLGIDTKEGNRVWLPMTIRRILCRPIA